MKENELKLAKLRHSRHQMTAPFAGVIAECVRTRGEWVEPGDTVLRLLRTDRLRAEGFLDARYATRLIGRPVEVKVLGADGKFTSHSGVVVDVGSEVDPVNGQVMVGAEIENPDRELLPGRRAEMTIRLNRPSGERS